MEKVDYVTERTKNGLDHIEHQKAGPELGKIAIFDLDIARSLLVI